MFRGPKEGGRKSWQDAACVIVSKRRDEDNDHANADMSLTAACHEELFV